MQRNIIDTYNCHEYSIPQIKVKGTKFTCVVIEYDEIESKFEITEIEGISMAIKEGTLTNKGQQLSSKIQIVKENMFIGLLLE